MADTASRAEPKKKNRGGGRGSGGRRGNNSRYHGHKDKNKKSDDTTSSQPSSAVTANSTTNTSNNDASARKLDAVRSTKPRSNHHPKQHKNTAGEGEGAGTTDSSTTSNAPDKRSTSSGRGGRGRGRGGRGRGRGRGGPGRGRGGRGRGRGRSNSSVGDDHQPSDTLSLSEEAVLVEHSPVEGEEANVESSPTKTLQLPSPPRSGKKGGKHGVPMILTRRSNPPDDVNNETTETRINDAKEVIDHDAEAQILSERLAAAALDDDDDAHYDPHPHNHHHHSEEKKEDPSAKSSKKHPAPKKEKKKRKKKEKKVEIVSPDDDEEAAPVEEDVSTTDALAKLRGQEVSITSNTTVQMKKSDSTNSLSKKEETVMKLTGAKKKKGNSKKKGLSNDNAANQRAARAFNKSVRACVERSDPDAMRDILHDRRNHNFALDKTTLETVMKAYVMAAMFDDALYCLRNCTLPGTLKTVQTERILTCMPQNLRNSSAYAAADMIDALCIATEFDNPTSRTYFLRIVRGISMEFLEEVVSARDRICSAPCERLVRAAVCVVDSRLRRGKKPTEILVEPGEQLGIFVPDSMENRGIQPGDAVSILPYAGPYPLSAESLDRNMIEATVTNTNPMVLRLQDKANANLYHMLTEKVDGNVYRIDKLANRMGFNRQLASAVAIASPLGDKSTRDLKRPSPELIRAITAMDENIDRVMKQTGFLKGEMTSTAALCAGAVPFRYEDEPEDADNTDNDDAIRMTSHRALDKYNALEGLNASQCLAVEGAVTNRLTLVQGPPGTGKTAVAIRILQHWARIAVENCPDGDNPAPILATSDSNIAVDNLVEGCAAVGLRVVRLGRPEAIRPELLRYCIDRPPSAYNSSGRGQQSGGGAMAYKERMKQLKRAQVVCCTCIGSGGDILDSMTFDRILVDEATQATEPAVLVPLMRGCRQLVLVGDHCQLPPTVLSTRAEEEGHGVPLFSRMVACGVPPFMLDTQYRMHPSIAQFPSDLFYGGKLLNGVTPPERRPLAGFPWPREEFPVAFVPVKGIEMDDGVSKMNEAEAAAAFDAVQALLSGGQCAVSDIAVVTPYAAQARLIRRMMRQLTQNSGPPYIEVSSVDGFQGREKEAVVFSAVRSNDYGAIGFTSDWRRVNVSFTRARRALIVIGNDVCLRRGDPDTWMPWLAWADAMGINMDKPGVPRGRYEPEQLWKVRGGTTAAEMLKDVLARQQAQLKTAQNQLEKAEKNAAGHIIGQDDDEVDGANGGGAGGLTLEEDLARITNTEGNWDDSDDEENDIHRSPSKATLTSQTSSAGLESNTSSDGPVDVWDL